MLTQLKKRQRYEPGKVINMPIRAIHPNPSQPRKVFKNTDLLDLSDSIKQNGVIQPITVRYDSQLEQYQLVAGERRLRAAALAGFIDIPCIITDISDEQSALIALVENLQRCDLDFFEEASGIFNLIKTYGFSQETVAKKLGKSQSAISNKLRLLKLPAEIIQKLMLHGFSERHARALLRLKTDNEQASALNYIIKHNLNVAQTEEYIDKLENTSGKVEKKDGCTFVFKDLRLFLNTIDHTINTMRSSGIDAEIDKTETEAEITMTIHIPKNVPRET